jgi:NAD(P)-dependent dehydrogenase (short-subunit alcohol dehydrogenase family)
MMRGLKDKVFLVTGGGSGIGAATVLRLLDEGAQVVAAGTRAEGLAKTRAAAGQAADHRLLTVQFDLRDEASIVSLVARTTERFGRLDGVANVAAAVNPEILGRDRPVDELDADLWAEVLRINLIGTGLVIRESLPALAAVGGGSIINVSSAGVFLGDASATAYNSSKNGLHALTRHTARTWGHKNVRCNVVAPGLILSERSLELVPEENCEAMLQNIPLPRHGQPEDLAAALVFLLSEDSSWITGQIFSVDGGLTMRE